MSPTTGVPDVFDHPYKAATWLVARHDSAKPLISRAGAWTTMWEGGAEVPAVALGIISEGLNAYDEWRAAWDAYLYANPMPSESRYDDEDAFNTACDRWEAAGPQITNNFAKAYGPMSSGERRFFRLLGILDNPRIKFTLFDASVSFTCCSPAMLGAPRPHTSFTADWAMLISCAVI